MYGRIDGWKMPSIHTYRRILRYAAGVEQRVSAEGLDTFFRPFTSTPLEYIVTAVSQM